MTGRVEGKVAFVTGAARGMGRAHALRLAEEGADVIASDVCRDIKGVPYPGSTSEDLAETVEQVKAAGRRGIAVEADVRNQKSLDLAVEQGVEEFGRLDIVVANAGIASTPYPAQDLPEQVWTNMLDINLSGVWRTCKAGIPHLLRGGRGGSLVLISSAAGLQAYANVAHYVAAKHGVVGLMRTLALELAPQSIRVNSLHPTQVDTPMTMNDSSFALFRPDVENATREDFAPASQAMHALPVPWIEARDVSNALLFLVSDEGRYITGVALPIDAGALIS